MPEASSRLAMLKTGEADIIWNPPPDSLDSLLADDAVVMSGPLYPGTLLININTRSETNPLLQNVDVRRALSHAVDPSVLLERLLAESGIPAHGPVPESMAGDCAEAGHYGLRPRPRTADARRCRRQ